MTITQKQAQVDYIWKESFQYELDDALQNHLRQGARLGIQTALEKALREELSAYLGFAPYQRTDQKKAHQRRSGYFDRQLDTLYGRIDDLNVPKLRAGNKDRPWQVLRRYVRAQQRMLDTALYLYLLGLSLRDLQETIYLFTGEMFSLSAVNRITEEVEEKVEAWRTSPIEKTPPVLIVDGVWVNILYPTGEHWTDKSGHERQRVRGEERVILAVMALFEDGRSHLLHYEVALEENEAAWRTLFEHLKERGLEADSVKLLVSDGTKGLLAAQEAFLPKAKQQRCTVHKVRGMERYLCYDDLPERESETGKPMSPQQARRQRRDEIMREAHDIFKAPTKEEAQTRLLVFEAKWAVKEPRAVSNFKWGLKRCFVFYDFAVSLHRLIHSTNLIERFFREFRSKADEIGSFANEGGCLTIFYLVMQREHAKNRRLNLAKTS